MPIESLAIRYSGEDFDDYTTIADFFKEYSIGIMCYNLLKYNKEEKFVFNESKLRDYLNNYNKTPKASAVMYRVVSEYMKYLAESDNLLENLDF